jgi:hypothetical protein
MSNPTIRIYNGDDFVDREMNEEEFEYYELQRKEYEAREKKDKAKAKLKEATLEKLGLTADEVVALLS